MQALGKRSVASIVRGGLGLAWMLAWVAAIVTIVSFLGYCVAQILAATGGLDPAWLAEKSQYIRLRNGHIENYTGPDWLPVFSTFALAGVGVSGALVIIFHLRKLFDSFLSGEPFRRENANHLRVIWITMLSVELSRIVVLIFAGVLLRVFSETQVTGRSGGGEFNIMTWASILILIVLAEVFREGARLKEEQELTI